MLVWGWLGRFGVIGMKQGLMKRQRFWPLMCSALLSASLTVGVATVAQAQSANSAPGELTSWLESLETAANQQDLERVENFYSADFATSDNVGREAFFQGLNHLWERFAQVNYTTRLESWRQEGDLWVVETVTEITGTQPLASRSVKMASTVRSLQYVRNQQIVRQDILSERTEMLVGDNPPQVDVRLPERVKPGERFNFDVIVQEPLGGELLLGGAMNEKVMGDRYLNPGDFDLELLQAGGLFKVGRAPQQTEPHWLSAILIRNDGMTIITQRLRVEN
ncbi:nuclear transport factor 2 family protein [Spirulina subsalsa FACHB-351]|uniref:Nuclear transport factor 2 family protein n=2 Tax=Spirulina subsalsa TaxID=54311 RepID=A0ABT3L5A1_9CYAN|nr:nuclear transport factor 2 family protein [Spirulina subsalsa FACHB-351]